MNKVGLYLHNDYYITLYFDNQSLKFISKYSFYESPEFDKALDALDYSKKLIDINEKEEEGEVEYKTFDNTLKLPNSFDLLHKELWSLDCSFAKYMFPRVLFFKIFYGHRTPGEFLDCDSQGNVINDYSDEWEFILDEIIDALKLISEGEFMLDDEQMIKVNRGLTLFSKYVTYLWT